MPACTHAGKQANRPANMVLAGLAGQSSRAFLNGQQQEQLQGRRDGLAGICLEIAHGLVYYHDHDHDHEHALGSDAPLMPLLIPEA